MAATRWCGGVGLRGTSLPAPSSPGLSPSGRERRCQRARRKRAITRTTWLTVRRKEIFAGFSNENCTAFMRLETWATARRTASSNPSPHTSFRSQQPGRAPGQTIGYHHTASRHTTRQRRRFDLGLVGHPRPSLLCSRLVIWVCHSNWQRGSCCV